MIPECVIFTSGNERTFTEERTNIRAVRLYKKISLDHPVHGEMAARTSTKATLTRLIWGAASWGQDPAVSTDWLKFHPMTPHLALTKQFCAWFHHVNSIQALTISTGLHHNWAEIIELLKLEKTSETTKSNLHPKPTLPTKPYHLLPHLLSFWTLSGMMPPLFPWDKWPDSWITPAAQNKFSTSCLVR